MNEDRQRRLLIASRELALLRGHYEDVIAALVRSGVHVSVGYLSEKGMSADSYRDALLQRGCRVQISPLPPIQQNPGELLAVRLRQLANLLRFQHPDFRKRDWLREIKFDKASPGPRRWATRLGRLGSRASLLVVRLAASVDRVLPPSEVARALVASERPDAVVAVPVIRTPHLVDVLKAAALEHIPTAIWIQSWDNLSSKGLLHFIPDRVFVWNTTQREELARYHGVPAQHVSVTGAQTFDHWFNGDVPSDRAVFCAENGLDPERPIILYLVSSRGLEPSPAEFFDRWITAIRSTGDPVLEGANVLVRPHPVEVQPWLGLDRDHSRLAVSPSTAEAPINSPTFRKRYRDELHHASVAVGLNTSGFIDAAIFGKPVCTVELPELAFGQSGTVHFQYLMSASGGPLRTAATLDEHTAVLADLVQRDPYEPDERSTRFVQAFVRPHGIDVEPAAVFADEMLRLFDIVSEPALPGRLGRAAGRLIYRAAPLVGAPLEPKPIQRRWRKSRKRMRVHWHRTQRRVLKARKKLEYRARLWRRSLPFKG
jgi:hypothetical protein